MAREFKLPDLGEGVHEGEVLAVNVSVGQEVKEGDIILEVETDKAAVEIPSPFSGIVSEIRVKPGDTVKVGDIVLLRADNIYVEVHTIDRRILTRQTLSTFLEELPKDKFIRVHRSYAVNRDFIASVSKNSLEVEGETIPISRSFRDQVHDKLNA